MEIRVKKSNKDGLVRLETKGQIKDILVKEDFVSPERISLCFRGKDSSGIVDLSSDELKKLLNTLKDKVSFSGAVKL